MDQPQRHRTRPRGEHLETLLGPDVLSLALRTEPRSKNIVADRADFERYVAALPPWIRSRLN